MPPARRLAKWALIGAAGCLTLLVVVAAGGVVWLRSESGGAWLARQIEQAASTPGETSLAIGDIEGNLPQSLVARDIVLSDGNGPWLSIAALELDWRPWQLLRSTVAVDRLAFSGVELARLPSGEGKEAQDAGGDPRDLLQFPLKIRLGRLTADEIALGEPVLGEAARLTLSGEAQRQEDGRLEARLDFRRIDGIEGRLAAAASYAPHADLLTVTVDAASARGGLLAAVLDMPDLPETTLKLAGSGPLANWSGDLSLAAGDIATLEAEIGLARGDGGDFAFRIDGAGDFRSPELTDLLRLVEGHTALEAAGSWQGGQRLQIDRLALGNDRLQLDLQGSMVPEEETIDLRVQAQTDDAKALARLAGLDTLDALSADVAVTGSLGRPQASVSLAADGLASAEIAADRITLAGKLAADRNLLGPSPLLSLDLSASLEGPRVPGQDAINQVLGTTLPLRLVGQLDLDRLVLDIETLETSAGTATLTATGPFDLDAGHAELDATVMAEDLAALQPLTEIRLGGRARLAGPVTLDRFGGRIAADLTGRWEEPASDVGLIAAVAGQGLDLATRLVVDGGEVRVEEVTARSPATALTASLTVADGALRDGRYDLRLVDAAVLAGELGAATAGPAQVEGTLAGPFDALRIDGQATFARLTVAEQALQDISGRYDLRVSGADIDGPVAISLASPFGAAEAEAELRVRSDAVTLAALRARLPQATAAGQLRVPLDGGPPAADLAGEFADLGPWLRLAGLAGGGKGSVAVKLNQAGAAAPLVASGEFSSLRVLPQLDAPALTVSQLTVTAEGQDLGFAQPGRVAAVATDLRWDALTLTRAEAGARGTLEALDVTLDVEGRLMEPLKLNAAAKVTRAGETTTVALARAEGRAFGQPLTLQRPTTLTLAPEATRLEGLALVSGDARLTADAALGSDRLMLDANLEALPLTAVDAFWNSGLAGQVSAEVTVEGPLAAPSGSARVTAAELRPRDSKDTPALQFAASASWQAGRVRAEGELGGAKVAAARFSADAPLRMTADGGVELPPREPLSGRLDWTGDIKTLLLFVPLPQHRLSGMAEVAVTLDGTLEAPQAGGRIALAEGRYENLETGTILKDLALTAELAGDKATLTTLSAKDGAGGTLTGTGDLKVDPDRQFPFDASIVLDKFHAVRRDDVTAVTGGKVTLSGDIGAPLVEGRFTTETVEISLLADLPPNVVTLDVIEVQDSVVQQPPQQAQEAPPIDVVLDVVVEMPRRVFVRGRGLDSEWSGRISVQGPASSPSVTGQLDLVRGQLSVVGKPFTLKSGKVTLPEGADTDPALDVTAEHQGKDLTVTARLHGPATNPELELSSVPPVPRDEIVSRVLFGKSAAQLSAAEAAQLAIALRDLTGKGGGTDILGFARRTLGVDVLRIETAETGAAVEAGKYLTDDVYVGVKQGADPQSTSAGVEVELTPNVTLESEVTGKGANKSGVRFQWDY